jgi:hypothetical protein
MTKISMVWIAFFIFTSCGDDAAISMSTLKGTYKGQFIRTNPQIKYAPANVTITLTENRFFGESDRDKYPAICNGIYTVRGREIEFSNECVWTANFDWTYILSGTFTFNTVGDQLEMIKYLGNDAYIYKLTLQ